MTLAIALTLRLLLAANGDCYFVSNTRILSLPSCSIGPSTIAELTEDPAPPSLKQAQQRRPVGRARARPILAVRGNEELERSLETEQRERIDAVARRLVAERQRDLALQERDAALQALAVARRDLAELQARMEDAGFPSRSESASAPVVDGAPLEKLSSRAAPTHGFEASADDARGSR